MTMATKHEVIEDNLAKYLKANKEEKGRILDRLEDTVHMERKSIIRRLRTLQKRPRSVWNDRRGRPVYYGKDVDEALKYVWEISHELCAERLHPVIHEYMTVLERDNMWHFNDEVTGKLSAISLGTVKNRVDRFDRVLSGGGRCLTKPSDLKEIIPVRRGPWQNPPPGFGEIDTVAHCGNDASGTFAWTLQYTDISLTWCFLESQMGKDKRETLESIKRLVRRSPFPIGLIDPDTGSEFINWHVRDWCVSVGISMTRIRPGQKNDHGRIEQKNDKNVRKFSGYIRVDTEERLATLKEMNRHLEVYINHFLPSMKCIEKVRYNISHSSRKYDPAKTPYQRFMEHKDIPEESKKKMKEFHLTLNPKILHDKILLLRRKLFKGAKFTKKCED
jgi:hypothetical protein